MRRCLASHTEHCVGDARAVGLFCPFLSPVEHPVLPGTCTFSLLGKKSVKTQKRDRGRAVSEDSCAGSGGLCREYGMDARKLLSKKKLSDLVSP